MTNVEAKEIKRKGRLSFDDLLQRWVTGQSNRMNWLLSKCESPLEKLMAMAFITGSPDQAIPWPSDVPGWHEGLGKVLVQSLAFEPAVVKSGASPARWDTVAPFDEHCLIGVTFCEGVLLAQHAIEAGGRRYRADFAIIDWQNPPHGSSRKFVIEVDGHDFHERTKEQAVRDRSRDRALMNAGWTVMRFTGSEVFHDPIACVSQVAAAYELEHIRRDRAYADGLLSDMAFFKELEK